MSKENRKTTYDYLVAAERFDEIDPLLIEEFGKPALAPDFEDDSEMEVVVTKELRKAKAKRKKKNDKSKTSSSKPKGK